MPQPPKRIEKPSRPKSRATTPLTRRTEAHPKSLISRPPAPHGERLQKVLARAGVASRRAAEELIAAGRVQVNGEVVREMGVRALPTDEITVDGKPIGTVDAEDEPTAPVYIMLNKPPGVVSTVKDTHDRPTVLDVVRASKAVGRRAPDGVVERSRTEGVVPRPALSPQLAPDTRIYPVGRLDADTTGLILLTDDGDLTFRLTHPRYGVEKEYRVLVRGMPGGGQLKELREGVEIEGGKTAPAKVEVAGKRGEDSWLRVTIREGRKRQVRLMMAAVGNHVIRLERVRFGPLVLGDLELGRWRYLTPAEVGALCRLVKLEGSTFPKPRGGQKNESRKARG